MEFGKNRVQYGEYYWTFYRYEKFDVYFYLNGKNLAQYTASVAARKLAEFENFFNHTLDHRIVFIVYNKLSEFRQSNIGLVTADNQANTGGVTKIIDNKVFLYFEGDHKNFDTQISAAIAEVLVNQILYGGNFREKITNSTLIELPEWYTKGLISYLSNEWDFEIENRIKDGILSGKYEKFNYLLNEDAQFAGHSIFYYVAQIYGKAVIQNIIYMTRINKNADSGFMYVLGASVKDISFDWLNFYKEKFQNFSDSSLREKKNEVKKRIKKDRVYQQMKMSPDGKNLCYSTNQSGKYKIYIYNIETQKRKKILTREHKLEQITDYSFPSLAWHPSGKILTYFTEEEGKLFISHYDLETKQTSRNYFFFFEKVLDFSYSNNGAKMVLSAILNGKSDIFIYNAASNSVETITKDIADDLQPRFIENSTKIIFSSNRISDTITFDKETAREFLLTNISQSYDLFIFDLKTRNKILTRISETPYINEYQPIEVKPNTFLYLSDESGIINRQIIRYDSTISYIDTAAHYRYFSTKNTLTSYPRNIEKFDYQPKTKTLSEILYFDKKFHLFYNEFDFLDTTNNSFQTPFRKELTAQMQKKDSLGKVEKIKLEKEKFEADSLLKKPLKILTHPDSTFLSINNYVFEREKNKQYEYLFRRDSLKSEKKSNETGLPPVREYFTWFYIDYLVNQVDFSFLNSSYQAFTGNGFYFNPGFNVLFKVGAKDLFENYKITGGARFAVDFQSNEYLLSFENLKYRLDKQFVLHRQVLASIEENSIQSVATKVYTHEAMTILRYPFSQVLALKSTFSLRYDEGMFLVTDYRYLNRKPTDKFVAGGKLEYIFDNTISRGVNLFEGFRYKIFGEFYQHLNDKFHNLSVLGADFRSYTKIHRNIIWANRFATSTSFGSSLLIYYLGGVDNWTNFLSGISTFDREIPIDTNYHYTYQAVATNMRGFVQNVRNGTSFAVFNSEIRFPIIRYFANRPISSEFFNNFQIVGFFDMGSAWTGIIPFAKKNAYDIETIKNGPIRITIDKERTPIVYGYGFGLRTKLFGYFIRTDWAWGIDGDVELPQIFYLSLNLDF